MNHREAVKLVREIRDLYRQSCELATRYNAGLEEETRPLRNACRAKPQKLIPELEHFENIFDRQEAMQKALAVPAIKFRQNTFMSVTWFAILLIAWYTLPVGGSMIAGLVIPAVLAVAAMLVHQRLVVYSEPVRRNLREQLVARGVPLCLSCGYDLRGQIGQAAVRCPECGLAARHLTALTSAPKRIEGGIAHVG